jgi:ABC-type sugar transport system ATPase subunit
MARCIIHLLIIIIVGFITKYQAGEVVAFVGPSGCGKVSELIDWV